MKEKNFNSIDLFKFIMAVAVVAIHTNPIVHWTKPLAIRIVVIVEEWAVPFFFTASGFFLFHAMEKPYKTQIKRIDKYMIKIIKMYCAWTLISLPLTVYGYLISENGIISCILSYFKYFLFVGKLYNSYHLWYLLSLIYALIAIRFLVNKGVKPILIMGVSVGVYLFGEIMAVLVENLNTLEGFLYKLVSLYQYVFNNGGIFTGMMYVSVGMLIACYRWNIRKWTGIVAIVALNFLKLCMSGIVIRFMMPVEVALLFMVLLEMEIPEHKLWKDCRRASTVIYLSHLIFFSIYTFIIIRNPNKLGFDSFIVTLTFSILNACLLIMAQKRGHFKLLKHII